MLLLLALGVVWPALAAPVADDFAPFTDAALEARYRVLVSELRCLVCQNESLADSHASLATDLRREVRGMLEAGQSDAEILSFLTDRYGAFVLYRPPFNLQTLLLWLGPLLLLIAALLGLWRQLQARPPVTTPTLDAPTRAAVARALSEDD
jgi:cytochrome c-type biogenesis protein CcmH/NrfF